MPDAPQSSSLETLRDDELVALCLQAGRSHEVAFEALYERYAPRVLGFLMKVTGDRTAAEDALQETFLRVHRSLERFDPQRDLPTWLLQIARYVAIDAFRVERKVKRLEEQTARDRPELGVGRPDEAAQQGERRRAVDAVLVSMSPEDRSLLLLRHFDGMTFRAIGEVVDCSARTAQNRVEAAARRFQRALLRRRADGGAS